MELGSGLDPFLNGTGLLESREDTYINLESFETETRQHMIDPNLKTRPARFQLKGDLWVLMGGRVWISTGEGKAF